MEHLGPDYEPGQGTGQVRDNALELYLGGQNDMQAAGGAVPITHPTVIQQLTCTAIPTSIQHCAVATPAQ